MEELRLVRLARPWPLQICISLSILPPSLLLQSPLLGKKQTNTFSFLSIFIENKEVRRRRRRRRRRGSTPVDGLHVLEQSAPLAQDHRQAPLGGVVLLVGLQVGRELLDAVRQLADLDLCAAHVLPTPPVSVVLLLAGRRFPIPHAAVQHPVLGKAQDMVGSERRLKCSDPTRALQHGLPPMEGCNQYTAVQLLASFFQICLTAACRVCSPRAHAAVKQVSMSASSLRLLQSLFAGAASQLPGSQAAQQCVHVMNWVMASPRKYCQEGGAPPAEGEGWGWATACSLC